MVPAIKEVIKLFEIFIGPLEIETRIRRRIEGALSRQLMRQPPPIGTFQDDDIRYNRRKDNEKPISVSIVSSEKIYGLPKRLIA